MRRYRKSNYRRDVFARERKIKNLDSKAISEAYHKAKADGSNSELVAAVEDLLGKQKESSPTPQTGKGTEDWSRDVESTAKALEGVELKPNEVSQFNDDWVSKRIFKEDSFFGSKAK